jgi:Fe-S-cluster containining protein
MVAIARMPMDIERLRLAVAHEASATTHALTLKHLRRKTIPLREIADEVTETVEVRTGHLFATSNLGPVACDAECAYCCYVPRVLVSLPELARIVERVQTWPVDQIDALKARLEAHVLAQSSDVTSPAARPPCALLVGRRCSAYEARPLVCRGQHAYNVQECKTFCETGAGETTQLTVVLDTVRGAVSGVVTAFHDMGARGTLLDLSRALVLALENPKVIAQAASGFSSLAAATVTSDMPAPHDR